MITCPWCGTNYLRFQSNCKNCGGILPLPGVDTAGDAAVEYGSPPPPAPRVISDQYVRRIMWTDGWAVASGIVALLGAIFTGLGILLTLGIVTAFVGIPFVGFGVVMLAISSPILLRRRRAAQQTVEVLREGEVTEGEITEVRQNYTVRKNLQHPWIIGYRFQMNGKAYTGAVSSYNRPEELRPGRPVYVIYLPDAPEHNAIYPHP